MIFNPKLDLAIKFATKAHKNQFRKTDKDTPYIYHPISVGMILKNAGFSDDVVIAGILHDVIEDSDVTKEEVTEMFGEDICSIVLSVSEDKRDSWEKRKADYEENVINGKIETKAVAVADKLHNIYNIIDILKGGHELGDFFKKDTNTTIDKYIKFTDALSFVWTHPLVDDLKVATKKMSKFKK
jgi:(p)ppGpp synthase/HD superfamily hydrolase